MGAEFLGAGWNNRDSSSPPPPLPAVPLNVQIHNFRKQYEYHGTQSAIAMDKTLGGGVPPVSHAINLTKSLYHRYQEGQAKQSLDVARKRKRNNG